MSYYAFFTVTGNFNQRLAFFSFNLIFRIVLHKNIRIRDGRSMLIAQFDEFD